MDDGERDYYILDIRSCVGNCALFWCPDGKGYTCDLDRAGLYTLKQAQSHRDTDVPIHKDVARQASVTHVRQDRLRIRPGQEVRLRDEGGPRG